MVLIILGTLILSYSFFDFKNAYYAFICYTIFWAPQAFCFTIGDRDVIINMVMSFGLFISFLVNYKKLNITKRLMPFTIPFIFVAFSIFFSCFFAEAGFKSEFTRFASKILQTYTTIFISWYVFETRDDFEKLIKVIIITFFIAGLYGIIEFVIQKNVFFEYKKSISTDMLGAYDTARRGYRVISLFDHSIGAGLNFGLVCSFILYLLIYEKNFLPFKKLSIVTSILCFICVFLSKARADYVYLLIALIPCFNPKKVKLKKVATYALLVFLITLPFTHNRLNLITSIFDSEAQSQVKGSSIELRLDQYDAVKEAISDSPIFGIGEKYENYLSPEVAERIKGAESVWLEQLLKHGVIGVLAHIVFAIFSVVIIPYKYKSGRLLFLGLAYWTTYSFTTFLSFRFDLYYCILFYFIKTSKEYIESLDKFTIISFK